jgi:cyanophycinase
VSLALAAGAAVACAASPAAQRARGHLVIVGGGGTGGDIVARTLSLAGGAGARVVVLAQASSSEERGEASAQMWRDAGAGAVLNLSLDDREHARRALADADLIWMPGGDQKLLMKALDEAGLAELVRACHARGAVVGGTSAGAAVMGPSMITGEGERELTAIEPGATVVVPALGLFERALVDQHFVRRQRANRLLGAVLDHPGLVGFGIDERTALVVGGGRVEAIGAGAVVVVDARRAALDPAVPGQPSAARGIDVHVLRAGMTFPAP